MEDDGCLLADTYLRRKSHCCLLGGWDEEGHRIVLDQCPFDDCILYMGLQVFECWVRRKRTAELVDKGYTVKQIAKELDVTTHTVNRYLRKENAQKTRGEIKKAG